MIKAQELQELWPQICYEDGQDITLQTIQSKLNEAAQENEIPVAFRYDQVRSGLLGGGQECLVIYHPEHVKDYFSIAVQVKRQGKVAFISIDSFGTSKLMKAEAVRKQILSVAKVGWDRAGDAHKDYNVLNDAASGAAFMGAAAVGIRHLFKGGSDKQKLEEERHWYSSICGIINEIYNLQMALVDFLFNLCYLTNCR